MALGEENSGIGATMLVSPTGGNFNGYPMAYPMPVYSTGNNNGGMGLGGDWGSLITLFLLFGLFGGMGGGFGGGGFGGGYDFPWIMNGQQGINNNVSSGFRDAQITDGITSVRDGISSLSTQLCGCCSDMQMGMAQGFNGVNTSINAAQNALTQQAYSNQIASLERSYAAQTAQAQGFNNVQQQLATCCCDNRAATQDVKYTIATEACNTRAANTANTQAILDKLCEIELDNARRENDQLRTELIFARGQASQTAQTADLRASQLAATNALVQELRSCPIPAQPVYGNTPIWTCAQNVAGGCGCNGGYAA